MVRCSFQVTVIGTPSQTYSLRRRTTLRCSVSTKGARASSEMSSFQKLKVCFLFLTLTFRTAPRPISRTKISSDNTDHKCEHLCVLTARPHQRTTPPETSSSRPDHPGNPVPRPGDLPYLIVGVVLGAFVFIIVAFIPICLWRVWAKQSECSFRNIKSQRS